MKIDLNKITKKKIIKILIYALLITAIVITLFPLYWMIVTAFKPTEDLFDIPPQWIPQNPTLAHFHFAVSFGEGSFIRYFINTIIVSSSVSAVTILLTLFSAYSFSRFRYRGRRVLLLWVLVTQMTPGVLLLISLYFMLLRLQMLNLEGLILVYLTFTLPFSVWMLKAFFDDVPRELEEQAMVDGCSKLGAMGRVILPVMSPGILATGLFNFITAWDEYMFAMTLIHENELRTLNPGIMYIFVGEFRTMWGELMAGGILITIPIVVVFILLQKYLVRGLTAGAIKG